MIRLLVDTSCGITLFTESTSNVKSFLAKVPVLYPHENTKKNFAFPMFRVRIKKTEQLVRNKLRVTTWKPFNSSDKFFVTRRTFAYAKKFWERLHFCSHKNGYKNLGNYLQKYWQRNQMDSFHSKNHSSISVFCVSWPH